MRKHSLPPALLVAASLFALPLLGAAAEGPPPLTLPEVLRAVMADNRDLTAARAAARAAAAQALEAGAARLPRLDLSGSFSHADDVMGVPPSPSAPVDPAFFTGWRDQWSLHLGARQILFAGGEVSGAAEAAGQAAVAAEKDARERELFVAYQAKELFYRLLLGQEQVRIAAEQFANARAHAADAGTRHRAGDASRFDLLRARVRAENLAQPLATAERARGETAALLSVLLGRQPDSRLAAAGTLSVEDDSLPAEAASLSAPWRPRPAVEAAEARLRAAEASRGAAGGARFPRLSLTATYDTRAEETADLFTARHDNWNAGLVLDYALFDGGASRARRARAGEQAEAEAAALARARQGAALDRERALLALREARASRASAAQTVAEAEEAMAISRVAYRAGTAAHLEVVDAEVNLAAARTRLAEADYRFLAARAQWDYATGSLPPEVAP